MKFSLSSMIGIKLITMGDDASIRRSMIGYP
jgi:hypothetical protein